jgi:hypothetical protein
MKGPTTMDKDTVANAFSAGAVALSFASTEAILTIAVLASALIFNLVRIGFTVYDRYKE